MVTFSEAFEINFLFSHWKLKVQLFKERSSVIFEANKFTESSTQICVWMTDSKTKNLLEVKKTDFQLFSNKNANSISVQNNNKINYIKLAVNFMFLANISCNVSNSISNISVALLSILQATIKWTFTVNQQ